ncbi:acyltransferase [Sphingobacterium paramultivorum]|uniref:Acyltransferase n=1 Tax=Sphingobacterium paramultivorum TaxID=2886510 RepID=A0A7G5E706_9SPHI|nr:acyltransferase [Sphingobacterium paramultivorum]QMV69781.1 acyltransferase [Sphingobacterium paramultivorum]WSO13606.1 acyltransferase [Sphingobacterium paramultivorum]
MINRRLGGLIYSLLNKYKEAILKSKIEKLKYRGRNLNLDNTVVINFPERISLAEFIHIGPNGVLNGIGGLTIKKGTIIGPNVYIHTANHNFKKAEYLPYDEKYIFKEVIIGENVWMGANVNIAPGTTVGEGCIIGMGAVLSGDIPPLSIVVGNPCKIIGSRNEEDYMRLKTNGKIYLEAKNAGIIKPDFN